MLKSKITAAALTLGLAALWSSQAAAQGEPVPPTAERPVTESRRPNVPMLTSGATSLAAGYVPSAVVAMTSNRRGDDNLYYPVAGPWMDLAERRGCAPHSCTTEAIYKGGLVAAGVAQALGAGLVLGSFIIPQTRTVPVRTAKPVIVPAQMGRAGAGIIVVGSF